MIYHAMYVLATTMKSAVKDSAEIHTISVRDLASITLHALMMYSMYNASLNEIRDTFEACGMYVHVAVKFIPHQILHVG